MNDAEWLLLNFTLPREPSRVRVSVWRKLKKHGSASIGQSMWLLPVSEKHMAVFTGIANEITQNNGTAYILRVRFVGDVGSEDIIGKFNTARNEEYREFLDTCGDFFHEIEKETQRENFTYAELEENEDEYSKLTVWLEKIVGRDFFDASLKSESEQKVNACHRLLDDFSSRVYASNEEEN